MQNFAVCNNELTAHIEQIFYNNTQFDTVLSHDFTNSVISKRIRELIPLEELRDNGVFFTGDELSKDAAALLNDISIESRVIDPACGAGNLLISVIPYLPVKDTLTSTLKMWGNILHGYDLHQEFIKAAKLRIILDAMSKVKKINETNIDMLESFLVNINVGSIFDHSAQLMDMTHILINPPFTRSCFSEKFKWGSGSINSAAVFVDFCIRKVRDNTQIVAVLPEVLRSGSNYKKWREFIASYSNGINISKCKQFDAKTNVDIFLLSLIKRQESGFLWDNQVSDRYSQVSDFFDISVGPVVPHRDKLEGPEYPFLKAKNTPRWETVNVDSIREVRPYSGRTVLPPFIVVRRTSSPSDKDRAVGTVITGDKPVVVENHLIIVKPRSGDVSDCRKLVEVFKDESTNNFLNEKIRCRHLTVSAIKGIPFDERVYE